jgi:hypothetical protein
LSDGTYNAEKDRPRERLQPISDLSRKLLPLQRSTQMSRCALYWIPVSTFPVPSDQRTWLLEFFNRFSERLNQDQGAHCNLFLQQKLLQGELLRTFLRHAADMSAVMGLSRRPGAKLPPPPTMQDVKDLQEGRKSFRVSDYLGDYCYWFLDSDDRQQRSVFLGHGGLSMVFLKPDAKSVPPDVHLPKAISEHFYFKQINLKGKMAAAARLSDPFLLKTKELFGEGLEEEPQYRGLLYIIPLLASDDFFSQPEDVIKKVFQVFDVYVSESPSDRGLILASKEGIDDLLAEILEEMRDHHIEYPIGGPR